MENLHIIRLESKLLFLQGLNLNSPKLLAGKDILILVLIEWYDCKEKVIIPLKIESDIHFEIVFFC